uniref:Ig-like domain-containing protein n=1 Tax=Plectus sambesii TaxID=2011161 RepID=A0A914XL50_9BILA
MKSMQPNVFWQKGYAAITKDSPRNYKFFENDQVLHIPKFDPAKDNGKYSCKVVDKRSGAALNREVEIGVPRKNDLEDLCNTLCSSYCGIQQGTPKKQFVSHSSNANMPEQ